MVSGKGLISDGPCRERLEQRTFEMSYGCAGEDEAGKEGEVGNAIALSMQPDTASRRRSQQTCDRSNVNCSSAL